jgi:hypothetical protein
MKSLGLLISAICWHLFRIATFRTAFDKLSDTTLTRFSFIGLYFIIGILRHCLVGEETVASTSLSYALSMGMTYFVLRGYDQNRTLFCAALGADSIGDILSVLLVITGVTDAGNQESIDLAILVLEFAWALSAWVDFLRLPKEMKVRGYTVSQASNSVATSTADLRPK